MVLQPSSFTLLSSVLNSGYDELYDKFFIGMIYFVFVLCFLRWVAGRWALLNLKKQSSEKSSSGRLTP